MQDFTEGNILKQVIGFSLPLLIANFLQSFSGIINIIWIGRMLGPSSIAAVTISMPIVFFLISGIIGLNIATNVIVAQVYGSKNMKLMEKVFANSLMTNLFLCLVISIFSIFFSGKLLDMINAPKEIKPEAQSFFIVVLIGLVFQFTYNWYSGALRGLGDSKTPLYILIVNTILNFIFVPIFIIGFGPIPKLGIVGAAIANILSSFLSLLALYFYTIRINPFFNIQKWDFTVDWKIIKKVFTIGIPASLQMVIVSFAGTVISYLVNKFGTNIIAAYGIGMQTDQLAFLPAMSIGIAISSMVGQNLGIGKYDRVKKIFHYSVTLSLIISFIFFIVIFFFPKQIASLFTKNTDVIGYAVGYLKIVSFTYICFALIFALQGIVRAAGDTLAMLILTIITVVIFRLPLAYFLSEHTSLRQNGIWVSILISTVAAVVLNYLYYINGRWKRIKIIHSM
jgi:putative MATE family efflux protein